MKIVLSITLTAKNMKKTFPKAHTVTKLWPATSAHSLWNLRKCKHQKDVEFPPVKLKTYFLNLVATTVLMTKKLITMNLVKKSSLTCKYSPGNYFLMSVLVIRYHISIHISIVFVIVFVCSIHPFIICFEMINAISI